ncbi:MAG TPA: acyl dehydratase [Porticoccus sp.]|nr:acyl dehydratase [Porticoccus sp.]
MNNNTRQITMKAIPSMASMLFKAATSRKPKQREPQFLPLKINTKGIQVDANKLEKFCRVCDFDQGDTLPLTYPHIMAFALHLQLMLEPEFPFNPVGVVHVRNRIRQQRAIGANETLDFCVYFGSAEQVEKGYEASFITEVRINGELVWDDLSVMLIRKGGSGIKKEKSPATETISYNESIQWQLASNKGRQYAAAAGDYNPIHLFPWTAKLMGFKRHIMHGMWSKSRTVAHLLPADYHGAVSIDVAFKLPIFLPSTVTLMVNSHGDKHQFEMKDHKGEKPHLAGELQLGTGITN